MKRKILMLEKVYNLDKVRTVEKQLKAVVLCLKACYEAI